MCKFVYICTIFWDYCYFCEILLFFPKTTILPRSRHLPSYKFPGPLQTSPSRRVSMIEPIFKSFRGTRAKTSTETFKNPVRRPISGHPPFEIIIICLRYCYLFEILLFFWDGRPFAVPEMVGHLQYSSAAAKERNKQERWAKASATVRS